MLRSMLTPLLLLVLCAPVRAAEGPARRGSDALRREAAEASRKGQHAEAAEAFKQAVALEPQNLRLLKDYMWALWNSKQYPEAVDAAHRALTLSKNDLEALNMLGRAQEQAGAKE